MSSWDKRYTDRLQLLIEILPVLDSERRFALKGGTAINLFEHDLPRLSVDIDLTWLPVSDCETDTRDIAGALENLAAQLTAPPLRLQVRTSAAEGARTITRLIASRGRSRVQIETTPVMRGSVHAVRRMNLRPGVERHFTSAEMQVLHFADLYAGKLAATLSRQHPRDLFDIGVLLRREGIDEMLWRTFLIYLTCSPKPAAQMLSPSEPRDFEAVFNAQFRGMTAEPVSVDELLQARAQLLERVSELLDPSSRAFLESVEREAPDFDLIGLPQAAELPGVKRKLQNLARRSPAKREADYRQLTETLDRIARKERA
jgi:predicted nucleotidyltransferase component of viral defense system